MWRPGCTGPGRRVQFQCWPETADVPCSGTAEEEQDIGPGRGHRKC